MRTRRARTCGSGCLQLRVCRCMVRRRARAHAGARRSHHSTWTGCTRPTCRRCSTCRASQCAAATTARSRCTASSVSTRRRVRRSTSTIPTRRSMRSSRHLRVQLISSRCSDRSARWRRATELTLCRHYVWCCCSHVLCHRVEAAAAEQDTSASGQLYGRMKRWPASAQLALLRPKEELCSARSALHAAMAVAACNVRWLDAAVPSDLLRAATQRVSSYMQEER
mmetsp:Transcript_19749/g.58582  ORF Transcript_19749/g.58582 Transcript_19749/m.58582 type:complete len:224 (-) Transcript_19749:333-1004(-)